MPTYSYRCTECGKAFDVQQSFTDDSLTVCPSCSGALRKVFSPVGVSFTGSGFYRNDSRATPTPDKSKGNGGSESSEKSPKKASEKTPTAESKSASTPAKGTARAASSRSGSVKKTSD